MMLEYQRDEMAALHVAYARQPPAEKINVEVAFLQPVAVSDFPLLDVPVSVNPSLDRAGRPIRVTRAASTGDPDLEAATCLALKTPGPVSRLSALFVRGSLEIISGMASTVRKVWTAFRFLVQPPVVSIVLHRCFVGQTCRLYCLLLARRHMRAQRERHRLAIRGDIRVCCKSCIQGLVA